MCIKFIFCVCVCVFVLVLFSTTVAQPFCPGKPVCNHLLFSWLVNYVHIILCQKFLLARDFCGGFIQFANPLPRSVIGVHPKLPPKNISLKESIAHKIPSSSFSMVLYLVSASVICCRAFLTISFLE